MTTQIKHLKRILFLIIILPLCTFADDKSQLITFWQSVKQETQSSEHRACCGFIDQTNLRDLIQNSSLEIRALAKSSGIFEPPVRQDSVTSLSGHFIVFYDTVGIHAVPLDDIENNGIPDYIDSACVYLDETWDIEITQLGFIPPPDDNGNATDIYRIYFTDFYAEYHENYYGLTTPENIVEYKGITQNAYTSFIELHKDYKSSAFYSNGLNGLKVTIAHEFNHALQLALKSDYGDNLFFMEMTSTWFEDYVYDDVNDYVFYLNNFFYRLFSISFTSTSGNNPYANCLYVHMLTKKYGPGIVKNIWDRIREQNALDAINSELELQNSSFAESQNQYAGWLYFTGYRSIPNDYFPEGSSYPLMYPDTTGIDALDRGLSNLGIRLIILSPQLNGLARAKVSSSYDGKFSHILSNQQLTQSVDFNSNDIITLNSNKNVILVLSNPNNFYVRDLEYDIERDKIRNGPDPIIAVANNLQMEFFNLPENAVIRIYNVLGQKIITLKNSYTDRIQWNLKDRSNRYVPSGMYIYHVKAIDFEYAGKMTILR